MLKNHQGQQVPKVVFTTRKNNEFVNVKTDDIFKNKTVVVFSLPGAFTPTCSSEHLPRFNELASEFKANGVDEIVCLSVNDAFVMEAWKRDQAADKVTVLPDGNGDFTRGMGMLIDKSSLGFGQRSWRYSMLVKNGVIEKMFIEEEVAGDPFEVSDADTMLAYINPDSVKAAAVSMFSKSDCIYCEKAKKLLREKGLSFEEINIGNDASWRSVRAITGDDTVPQVFIDGIQIGGSDELEAYFSANHHS